MILSENYKVSLVRAAISAFSYELSLECIQLVGCCFSKRILSHTICKGANKWSLFANMKKHSTKNNLKSSWLNYESFANVIITILSQLCPHPDKTQRVYLKMVHSPFEL